CLSWSSEHDVRGAGWGRATAAEWYLAEPRRAEGPEEAGQGAEEVRQVATQGRAQDAEDRAQGHEVPTTAVLSPLISVGGHSTRVPSGVSERGLGEKNSS